MSDDPSRYRFGIEEPVLPVVVAVGVSVLAALTVCGVIAAAFVYGIGPVEHLIDRDPTYPL